MVGRVLWKAGSDAEFRRRLLHELGGALAEEGFILTDGEMAILRAHWESWRGLNDRAAYERITAAARAYRLATG